MAVEYQALGHYFLPDSTDTTGESWNVLTTADQEEEEEEEE